MESKAKLAGHPAHQILIVFPLGLLATSVIFDVVHLINDNPTMSVVAYWMITAGLISGLVAAIPGLIDWRAIPAGTRAKKIGLMHGLGNVLVLLLFGGSWFLRTDEPHNDPSTLALICSFIAFAIAGVTGWLGGELVDRLGVGVDPGAHLNALIRFQVVRQQKVEYTEQTSSGMTDQEQLTDSAKYQNWHSHLVANDIRINDVEEVYLHRADKDDSILYALLKVDADTPEGTKLIPICFLKGDAVSMLVVLIDEETNDKYVLLVRQRRLCDGSATYEHPAGMIDEDNPSPIEVAARELKEETQLTVEPSELKPLFNKPLFSASSTSDEALYFFYLERRMPLGKIKALHGRATGKKSEHEHTQLHIARFAEAHQLISNMHGILGHLLYLQQVGDFETMRLLAAQPV